MDIQQIVDILYKEKGEDGICDYCIYVDGCPRGVTGTPSEPSYPPCADCGPEYWFDLEAYEEDK